MKEFKLLRCPKCGKIVEYIDGPEGCPTICCGEPMKVMTANTTDAALEKHVPCVEIEGDEVLVQVGSVLHPMTPEHHISFIYLITDKSVRRVDLDPVGSPVAKFYVKGEKPLAVYEYCNLHGLWKAEA